MNIQNVPTQSSVKNDRRDHNQDYIGPFFFKTKNVPPLHPNIVPIKVITFDIPFFLFLRSHIGTLCIQPVFH